MSDAACRPDGFDAVKARLEEIADAVSNDDISLDQALDLFEEAVTLGMQASDLLEEGVFPSEEEIAESDPESASSAQASDDAAAASAPTASAAQADDADALSA